MAAKQSAYMILQHMDRKSTTCRKHNYMTSMTLFNNGQKPAHRETVTPGGLLQPTKESGDC